MRKYAPVKSLNASNTESPWASENKTINTSVKEVNLSLLQKIQRPNKINPKNIGDTPSK